ncbi:MAG: hypothetical protein ACK4NF_07605, partial [Planctomycetota bacterium]
YLSNYEKKKFRLATLIFLFLPLVIVTYIPLALFKPKIILIISSLAFLFLIPSLIRKEMDTLAMLHLYIANIYLQFTPFFTLGYKYFDSVVIVAVVILFYLRTIFLQGVFRES